MAFTVRPITDDEVEIFRRRIARGFGGDLREEDSTRFRKVFEIPRTVAAFDGDEMIGTGGEFSFEVTVPGGTLPMGGTTIITVQPTHRRQGALTAMMRAHLDEIRGQGEPLAGLWASETSIYGRFGFGAAVELIEMNLDARTIGFHGDAPGGRVRLVEPEQAAAPFRALYEAIRPHRPGMLSRSDAWWEWRVFADPESWREGRSTKRFAIYDGASGAEGYVIYRQKDKWENFPEGTVHVVEVVTTTPDAHHALWRFLTSIDLYPNVRYWNLRTDDELPWRVTESRRVLRNVTDSLWLRVLDIPRSLSERAYGGHGRLVLGITDPFLPDNDGHYELVVTDDGARCRPTTLPADVELAVDTLGAAYFGVHRFTLLAEAGLVRGSAEALATADRLFAWSAVPWCPEVF